MGNDHCIKTQNDRDYFGESIGQNQKQQFYVHFGWLMVYQNGNIEEFDLIMLFEQSR